jgi:LysM repeat protein
MSQYQNLLKSRMTKTFIFFLAIAILSCGCSSGSRQYNYANTQVPPKRNTIKPHTPPSRTKPNYPRYIVQKGDNLTAISRRSGMSVANIKRFNHLKSEHLEIGQVIYLPGVYKLSADHKHANHSHAAAPTISRPIRSTGSVTVKTRSAWSIYKIKGNITPMGKVNKITVHHTDDGPALSKMTDIKFLRAIENHHRNTRKWACIGYHYIIGRDGTIYEGRPVKYQGAHARSNNPNNVGISLIGDFNKSMPAKSQITSLEAILAKLRIKYKVPASRVFGHGHLGQTHCPGKHLKNWLEVYRSRR